MTLSPPTGTLLCLLLAIPPAACDDGGGGSHGPSGPDLVEFRSANIRYDRPADIVCTLDELIEEFVALSPIVAPVGSPTLQRVDMVRQSDGSWQLSAEIPIGTPSDPWPAEWPKRYGVIRWDTCDENFTAEGLSINGTKLTDLRRVTGATAQVAFFEQRADGTVVP